MRVSLPFGVIAASRLLHLTAAQASYGEQIDSPTSAGQDDSPKSSVTVTAEGGISNGPNGQSCSMQDATTVFITVYPTGPAHNDNTPPLETTSSDGTVYRTVHPTHTVQVSPLNSAPGDKPTVEIFTTLTISDLWVGGSSSGSNPATPVSDSDSSPVTTGPVSNGASASGPGNYDSTVYVSGSNPAETSKPVDAASTAQGNAPNASPYSSDNIGTANNAPQGSGMPNGDESSYTTVTDTVVEWVTSSDGPSPITVLSAHTRTLTPAEAGATSGLSPAVTCWTVTGSDGKETVVESNVSTKQENSGTPISTINPTVTDGSVGAQSVTSGLSENTPVTTITAAGPIPVYTGPGMVTSTAITILGNDGTSTIVHSTWVMQTASVTAASDALPTGSSISPQGGDDITSRTTFTVLGSHGRPTVVESTLVIPASVVLATDLPQNLPNGITVQATPSFGSQTIVSGIGFSDATPTCSSYTLLGSDGKLTVVETTYLVSGPTASPGASGTPSGLVTGIPSQITVAPSQVVSTQSSTQALTTCVSYTVIGTDGLPTVTESTIAMPNSNPFPTGTVIGLPSAVSQNPTSALPQGTQLPPQAGQPFVTGITVDIVGPNGIVTPVIETVVLTAPLPVDLSVPLPTATLGLPSMVSQILSDLPQGVTTSLPVEIPLTTALTIPVVGSNGLISSLVQTIVNFQPLPALTSGIFSPFTAAGAPGSGSSIVPKLQDYGSQVSPAPAIPPPPAALSLVSGILPAGTDVIPKAPVFTVVTGLDGMASFSVITGAPVTAYGNPGSSDGKGLPASQSAVSAHPSEYTFPLSSLLSQQQGPPTAVQTSTWVNIIPEPTTTHTLKFPLTTLVTVAVPAKISVARRALIRRASVSPLATGWSNSSSTVVQTTPITLDSSTKMTPPPASTSDAPVISVPASSAPSVCPAGSKIGNNTLNFDNLKPGPLFNPSGDLWFSEGFLVSPLSPQTVQGCTPSSGGQLIEFVPPSLTSQQSSDTAEIGVGPNSANPCFRFNLYGANLGCAARAAEQWCEFHISAFTYNQAAANEMSIAWSEVKRVPACPSFPNAPCPLTPVAFDGYQNITSVLIQVRVGADLRTWWADDFSFGWTDNSCAAAQCRENVDPQHVKREVVESAVRRGVWSWTPAGLRRLDDDFVWDSAA
ncbi:hypothetical protein EsDP_00002518 [Epichloe bromicola]|uniref:DUF7371 domain-containing protein n=1 Tax=Epichloe bromicola TaxID=79588 RepID=A0ABQ0CL20_9HYPO